MDFQRSARRLRAAALLPMLAVGLAACGDDDDVTTPEGPGNIAQVALEEPRLSTLVSLLQQSGLSGDLAGPGPFTVFAPVNEAFNDLPTGWVASLLDDANEDLLVKILGYHVVAGEAFSTDLSNGQTLTTLEGTQLTVNISGGTITISDVSGNDVSIVEADIEASNGVIHLTRDIFVPELDVLEMARITGYSTLVSLVETAGLTETLEGEGPFTIFAPSNEALEGIVAEGDDLTALLTYHVIAGEALESGDLTDGQVLTTVQGEDLTVNIDAPQDAPVTVTVTDANGNVYEVTEPNLIASNAVIHGIEGVLLPAADIPTVAGVYGYSSLVNAVEAAGLTETLQGDGPFTVFAPSNAAFENQPTQLPSEGDLLPQFLTYHVVAGAVLSTDLTDGQTITTVEGSTLTVSVNGETGAVTLTDAAGNRAAVEVADIRTSNGVIHGVDAVLVPELSIPVLAVYYGFSTLAELLGTATLEGTPLAEILADETAEFTVFAPTNEAFEALETVPEGDDLTNVLLYHVVAGTVLAGDLTDGQEIETIQGDILTVSIDAPQDAPATVTLTDANENVVTVGPVDVLASNGVIHVIDGVVIPATAPR